MSPKVLEKVTYAGVHEASFDKAERSLKAVGELHIAAQRVRRATLAIGEELVAQRDAAVAQFEAVPLPQRRDSPVAVTPQVVAIEMDGGRIQYRDRQAPEEAPQVQQVDGRKGRFWRETKVGVLLTMASSVSSEDPCPALPEVFLDRRKMPRICREIQGMATVAGEPAAAEEPAVPPPGPLEEPVAAQASAEGVALRLSAAESGETAGDEPAAARQSPDTPVGTTDRAGRSCQPTPLVRSVVATRRDVHEFGRLLVAAAWQRGFLAAERKAFLGDGLEQNWTVWQRHFSDFVPILDFVHALCHAYAAALAGRTFCQGWPIYAQWAQWLWSGRVDLVLAALAARQAELGQPEDGEAETSPRRVVADTGRYFENQRGRMKYDDYRRQGLPLTTAHVESVIKQIGRRVKGTEKFWSTGGEAILELCANYLSETEPMTRFWVNRAANRTGHRRYSCAA